MLLDFFLGQLCNLSFSKEDRQRSKALFYVFKFRSIGYLLVLSVISLSLWCLSLANILITCCGLGRAFGSERTVNGLACKRRTLSGLIFSIAVESVSEESSDSLVMLSCYGLLRKLGMSYWINLILP
jgi:hypothetical protein